MRRDFWRNVKLLLARLSHLDVKEQQQREIDYLREENQTLRDCLKATGKRMILTDVQRKNLSIKAVALGTRLEDVVSIVRPATLLGWHRQRWTWFLTTKSTKRHEKKSERALAAFP